MKNNLTKVQKLPIILLKKGRKLLIALKKVFRHKKLSIRVKNHKKLDILRVKNHKKVEIPRVKNQHQATKVFPKFKVKKIPQVNIFKKKEKLFNTFKMILLMYSNTNLTGQKYYEF